MSKPRTPRATVDPATKPLRDLTGLQLAILAVLWERGEATAHQVHAALEPATGLARGTIGTLLHRLEHQGILDHRLDGREYLYRPTVTRAAVQEARVGELVGGLFGGSLAAMVSFAVARGEVSRRDLARIRELLDEQTGTRKP